MNSIVNRSYYVALYIVKSIELLDNFDSKKYLGVISYLIKTRLIDSKFSKIIGHLQKTGNQVIMMLWQILLYKMHRKCMRLLKNL